MYKPNLQNYDLRNILQQVYLMLGSLDKIIARHAENGFREVKPCRSIVSVFA
jgi:hypothetical protein